MAQLKDLIVSGVTRCLGKLYASEFVGKLTGTADRAISDNNGANITNTYIKGLSVDENTGSTLTYTKGDNTTETVNIRGTEYSQATDSTLGLVKLYSNSGNNTDGSMTQQAVGNALTALLVSPALSGTPTAPTVSNPSDDSTKIATTAFVQAAIQKAIEDLFENGTFIVPITTADGDALVTGGNREALLLRTEAPSTDTPEES